MTQTSDAVAVADALFGSIEGGDVDAVRSLYADDVEIWHNYDRVVQGRDDNLAVLQWLTKTLDDIRYEDIRREPIDGGFMQQHVLTGKRHDGERIEIPACILVRVRDGHITRIDEYLDSAHVLPLVDVHRR